MNDPQCRNCGIPLRAVVKYKNCLCSDVLACSARRKLLLEVGPGYLINPDGVTRFEVGG